MSPAAIVPSPLPSRAAEASERLHAAIEALPEYAVPCVADGHGRDWLSEDPAAIDRAAEACSTCPVLDLCERFGVATKADGVVLAGRRWTPWTSKNLTSRSTKTSSPTGGDHERNNR